MSSRTCWDSCAVRLRVLWLHRRVVRACWGRFQLGWQHCCPWSAWHRPGCWRSRATWSNRMSRYDLVSHWHLDAPMDQVWRKLVDVESWPTWWSYVQEVIVLDRGDAQGVGAVHRVTWGTRVPNQLTLTMKRVVAQP